MLVLIFHLPLILFVMLYEWKVRQKVTRGVLFWGLVIKCKNYSKIKDSKEQWWQYYLYYLDFRSSALGCDTAKMITRRVWRNVLYGSLLWWDVPIQDGSKVLTRIVWQTSSIWLRDQFFKNRYVSNLVSEHVALLLQAWLSPITSLFPPACL